MHNLLFYRISGVLPILNCNWIEREGFSRWRDVAPAARQKEPARRRRLRKCILGDNVLRGLERITC